MTWFDNFEDALDFLIESEKELGVIICLDGSIEYFEPDKLQIAEVEP